MVPADLIARYRTAQQSLVTLSNRDLLAVWRTLDLTDAESATTALLPTMRELTGAYGDQAAVIAADFYDDARAAVGPPGSFLARPGQVAGTGQVDALTRWAVGPLWAADPRYGDALVRLAGGSGRLIRAAGANTIVDAAHSDPEARGWRRNTAPGACQFCRMLADRGAVYREDTARFAAHDHCACTVSPAWDDGPEADVNQYVASQRSRTPDQQAQVRDYLNANYPR